MSDHLLTPRLILRRWRPEDEPAMAEINRDSEVTRYLNRPVGDQAVKAFSGVVADHWAEHGFGFYAAESREAEIRGRFIGFVGAAYPTFLPELAERPELGWRLARAAWGRGLATEAASAARDDAFSRLRLPELISIIHPGNERSKRVAEKLGMRLERHVLIAGTDREVEVWQARRDQAPAPSGRSSLHTSADRPLDTETAD